MPLPANFSQWEHLQDQLRIRHNRLVQKYFKDVGGADWSPDISTSRGSLRVACTIQDGDTSTMTLMRLFMFHVVLGNAFKGLGYFYGNPVQEVQRNITYKPQVKLVFREPHTPNEEDPVRARATGEITFRLMDETSETISRAKAEVLAKAIKREIGTPKLVWEKGKHKVTYLDIEKGYDFRLLVNTKTDGEQIVRKILSIQSHSYDKDNFQFIENDRNYPANPGTHRVYGRQVKKPVARPRVNVTFRYAQLLIWGQQNAVNLVAVPGTFKSVIEYL
jgi:hypothetical protein